MEKQVRIVKWGIPEPIPKAPKYPKGTLYNLTYRGQIVVRNVAYAICKSNINNLLRQGNNYQKALLKIEPNL